MTEFIFIILAIYILSYVLEFDLKQYFKKSIKQFFNDKPSTMKQSIKKESNHHPKSTYEIIPTNKSKPLSYAEKLKKGKEYESIIATLFSCRGYTVVENGKIKGKKDGGIDLVAYTTNETILIQCKNWKSASKYKIRHEEVKKLRAEGRDFLEDNKKYVCSDMKLLFVLAEDCVHPSAKHHIEDIKNKGKKVDIEIIPIFNAQKEINESLDVIIEDRKSCPRCNQGFLVPRSLKNKKYQGKHKQDTFLGCSRFPKCKYSEDMD